MRPILFSGVIVFGLGVVFTLAVEAYVRLSVDDGLDFHLEMWKYAKDVKQVAEDSLLGHRHAPNRKTHLMGVEFETNSHGLRMAEIGYERTPGVNRIVMLGDSLTVGWGVASEQTFSARLEQLYAGRGTPTDVVNTGVGNWNTVQEVQFFLTEAYKYEPDVVVLNFFVNDAEPIFPEQEPSWLMRHCFACVFLGGRLDTLSRQLNPDDGDWASYYLGLYGNGDAPGWRAAKEAIGRLTDYCERNEIPLILASLPELHDVKDYRFGEITDLLRETADVYGIPFVDLLPYLEDQASSALWVTPPDPHPNGFANEFIARGLLEALDRIGSSQ